MSTELFLGGSCNPTTWRADIAIPLLEQAGVSYYNPQVDNWYRELVEIEARLSSTGVPGPSRRWWKPRNICVHRPGMCDS
jgi:hypothetical protein